MKSAAVSLCNLRQGYTRHIRCKRLVKYVGNTFFSHLFILKTVKDKHIIRFIQCFLHVKRTLWRIMHPGEVWPLQPVTRLGCRCRKILCNNQTYDSVCILLSDFCHDVPHIIRRILRIRHALFRRFQLVSAFQKPPDKICIREQCPMLSVGATHDAACWLNVRDGYAENASEED